MNRDLFETLSIPHYVIKKGPLHGASHGNTERQRIYHAARNEARKARKRGHKSILDRFHTCPIYRESQLAIGWDEAFCVHDDNISNDLHTYVYTADEHKRLETNWVLQLNSQGPNSPMKQRDDYADAVKIKDRFVQKIWRSKPKKYIQANEYGEERINLSQNPVKEPKELTRKPDGNGILLPPHQVHLRHGGNQRAGMNSEVFDLNPKLQVVFTYKQWRFPCNRWEV